MTECDYCNTESKLIFICPRCGNRYCKEHRKPESHSCASLQEDSFLQSPEESIQKPLKLLENDLEYELVWMYLEGKKASRIRTITDADVSIIDNWEDCFTWLLTASESFQDVFSNHINNLS